MIINVGARTDIVNYYSEWLFRRFREGFAYTRNPLFPNKVTRYELTPDKVDAVIFCSKNYAPILPRLGEISNVYRTYFHYTITAYGRDLEPNVPDIDTSVKTLLELERLVGRQRISWRYDPVLLTPKYTPEVHLATFERLASILAPHIDRCVFSFVEMYAKLHTTMPELIPLDPDMKNRLAEGLGRIAKKYGIHIQTCGECGNYTAFGIERSGCTTLDILGKANNCTFREMPHKGLRRGCHCIESRDLGWYDTCPNLCKYCYANKSDDLVAANRRKHDPEYPLLIGHLEEEDELRQGVQTSFLKNDGRQISLFD